jgi:class 3 adenylate cyclase/tetratricopeptide (TPR) repeat protein
MDFYATLDQAVELLRSRGRVSYRALKEQLGVDDERVDALRAELLYSHADEVREDGRGLVWAPSDLSPADAERRQLTVLFCDLVDSTSLSGQLDPEEFREVMRAYYDTCGKVIARFDGYIAQYLGDGLLVFFGYPRAHEDDAQRAVRAGLGIVEAVGQLNNVVREGHGVSLAVRLGCHTGLVVVGEVVGDGRHEMMAAGDTPNIAARLQEMADINTLVVGPLTHQLLGGFFNCRSLGTPPLKGVATPLEVYEVLAESTARSRLEAIGTTGLTPLVGRATEVRLLEDRWADVVSGRGQVLLVNGEAGIGKSRLVLGLTEHAAEHHAWLTPLRGSPYHEDTALHPFIDLLTRTVLRAEGPDSTADTIRKLEGFLVQSGLSLDDEMPHFCSLLSVPLPAEYAPSELGPDQQKRRTMQALLAVLLHRAAQQPVLFVVEDLHWVDPTTLELLGLVVEQVHNAPILALFTSRPEFRSPWTENSNVTELDLTRLVPDEAAELARRVARGKELPDKIVEEVVAKTDGVPLFVEELTKMLLESGLLEERAGRYELAGPLPPLAIPNTLHDSLMARLDRLSAVKALAQLGAAIGREFTYALIRAVSSWDEDDLRQGLDQLVAAEFLYEQGTPGQATFRFKHALIQDAAYQSLLKSTRQHHHQRIANTLESDFPELVATQPEVLAHHYTQAGLSAQAVPFWLAAGQRALQRHANREAANHATKGLELLRALPETPGLAAHELSLQLVLGPALSYVNGPQSVEHVYVRARELARQVGSAPELFPALSGLAYAQIVLGHMHEARALSEEMLELAQRQEDPLALAAGHWMLAYTAWWQGDFIGVRSHSRQCLALYDLELHRAGFAAYNQNPAIVCGYLDALNNWVMGYPTQAVHAMERTLAHAYELGRPNSIGISLLFAAQLAQLRREPEPARARAEEALSLAAEHDLPAVGLWCLLPRGWAIAEMGDVPGGIVDIREAMDRRRAFGMGAVWPWFLALLADAYRSLGQIDEGLAALEEAQQWVQRNDERLYAAEVYRLEGELVLRQEDPDPAEAEECFEQALTTARDQQAKSWELRAALSMARMWVEGGRLEEARDLLSPVYHWFTEGFDTADLKDAKALLEQLS